MIATILKSRPLQAVGATVGATVGIVGAPPAIVTLEASENEMSAVADLHAETFSPAWSEDEILRLARRPGGSVWLARTEGRGRDRPLGFLILSRIADEAEIISVGVARKARRRGVGDALVRHAIREAQAARAATLFLEVDESNTGAIALYRRLGFRQVGERKSYYRDEAGRASRALVMSVPLR